MEQFSQIIICDDLIGFSFYRLNDKFEFDYMCSRFHEWGKCLNIELVDD